MEPDPRPTQNVSTCRVRNSRPRGGGSTGCIRLELALTVHEDGSGRIDLVYSVDAGLADAYAGFVDDGDTGIWGDTDLPPNASVEPYSGDGFTGDTRRDPAGRRWRSLQNCSVRPACRTEPSMASCLLSNPDDGWHFEFHRVPILAAAAEITYGE